MQDVSQLCPNCGFTNRAGKRFCAGCANPLAPVCASCGAENLPQAHFCDECGASLSSTQSAVQTAVPSLVPATAVATQAVPATQIESSAPHEERRMVTVLFCDLVGFTPLSERLDPEEVRDIQASYFERMSAQVERFGGTVEKYAGDAVLALFGAPIAHEDDAERAVLCALGMQTAIETVALQARERWNVEPALRVGVNTGEVISGTWDAGGRQDVAVTGDAVNTAARIQSSAEPGEVLVGEEAMRLTQRRIVYGEKRKLVLKGKAGEVSVYPALEVREHLTERWEGAEHLSPLVGREREIGLMLDTWKRVQDGEGQLVTLVGDPGVGKSRLISELLQTITSGAAIRVVRGRSLSYGQEISLWLVADFLRGLFGIGEQDAADETRVRVSTTTVALLGEQDKSTQADAIDVLGEVLGLQPGNSMVAHAGAQVRRQALVRSLRLLLSALSDRAPTVMVLEDLHWVDEASQGVLSEILADVPGLRLLVLATQRPGWTPSWGEWGWVERITLRPLTDQDAALLAGSVLGGKELSPELESYVAERAGGNPFFVEEMLRALQEAGDLTEQEGQMHLVRGAAERLPSTLTEVLLARLDRLEPDVRGLTQMASVIGRSFAVRLLATVSRHEVQDLESPLAALQRAEIAFPRRGSDPEYAFKHVSMREVAYNTLVQRRRQALHLATARAIAQLYSSDEYVEMIAYHYARTDEHAEAAIWLERAGDRAAGVYANETAIANYQEARRRLELSAAGTTAIAQIDEKLGNTLSTIAQHDEALQLLASAVVAYREVRDLEAVARVTARIGWTNRYRGTPEEGIAQIEPLLDLVAWSGPSPGLASLHLALATLHFGSGRYKESLAAAERSAELARAVGDERILAGAEMRRGSSLVALGQTEEGLPVLEKAVSLAEAAGDLETLGIGLNNLADGYLKRGELDRTRKYLERALEIQERVGHTATIGFQMVTLSEALIYQGEGDQALVYFERGADLIQSVGASWYAAYPGLQRGHLLLRQGQWEDASTALIQAIALAEPIGDSQALALANWWLAEIELLRGQPEAARARLEPLTRLKDYYIAGLLTLLAWAYLDLGDPHQAGQTAQEALSIARESQQFLYVPGVLQVQGMIQTRQEKWQEAGRSFEEAASLARSMPYPYSEASSLHEHGMMHVKVGNASQARECLEQALSIFRRLGAAKDVERTELAITNLKG